MTADLLVARDHLADIDDPTTEELHAYDKTESAIRIHDAGVGVDQTLKARLAAAGVQRISFRGLRDAMRAV